MQEYKICKVCKETFPLTSDHFYKNKKYKDGFEARCKKCKKEYDKIYHKNYYKNNKIEIAKKTKERRQKKIAKRIIDKTPKFRDVKVSKKSYSKWRAMIARCTSETIKEKNLTYKDCEVCNEWLDYPNFQKWYEENYYEVEDEQMHLDKDILIKGNKIYSPETCIFVPCRINVLFTKSNKKRGDLPIGVKRDKKAYVAQCSTLGRKKKYLGRFNTPEEAFVAYKAFKEKYIKEVADLYKDKIPKNLYDAMYRYEVEITD